MNTIFKINSFINGIVWGPPMLCIIVGSGIYLSMILKFPQLRYFWMSWKELFSERAVEVRDDQPISSFAATMMAMAATVGTGNIAGVATALHLGGPGALFWMLVSAFFGMCTKFCEVTLAVDCRQKDEHGDWRGGTMYILEEYTDYKWLGVTFAVFALLASFGIGSAVQANSAAEGLQMAFGVDPLYSGMALAMFTSLVIIGGLHSLSPVTKYLVPFMVIFYTIGSIIVLMANSSEVPDAIGMVFQYAISDPMTIPGALAGWSVRQAVSRGIARGVFSNEAGLGSAPMAHAAANVDHPARQGLYGILEVFIDTMIICTLSGLVILSTHSLTNGGAGLSGARLALFAFEQGLGTGGKYILSISLFFFAYTTILGWYWHAETASVYLFGSWFKPIMTTIWIGLIFLGAAGNSILVAEESAFLNNLWDMADTLNALMALPNLVGLLLLSGVLKNLVEDFDERQKNRESFRRRSATFS